MLKALNIVACAAAIVAGGVYMHGEYIERATVETPTLTKAQADGITTGLLCAMGDSVACAKSAD